MRQRESHGHAGGPEYQAWCNMKARCYRTSRPDWKHYGGRGLTVCERWRNSFAAFLADIGPRPSELHSLEREDVNGHYEPGNCVWLLRSQQQRNIRRNEFIEAFGVRLLVVEWAELLGVSMRTIRSRINYGWSPERIVTEPVDAKYSSRKPSVEIPAQTL